MSATRFDCTPRFAIGMQRMAKRGAIIRNLLERVNELPWRVNGGFTSAAKIDERPAITGSANSRVISSLTSINTVISTATYDTMERQATEALDQALIVEILQRAPVVA